MNDAAEQLFDDVTALVDLNQCAESASFLHGRWIGSLCTKALNDTTRQALLEEACWQNLQEVDDQQLLEKLVDWTFDGLSDPLLNFHMLLPSLDLPITVRAEALVQWMEGFIHGIGESGISESDMTVELRELLKDFMDIAKLDSALEDENETDEKNLFELVEYCRVAVITWCEEFALHRQAFNNEAGLDKLS